MKKKETLFLLFSPLILICICSVFLFVWNINRIGIGFISPSLIIIYSIFFFLSFCFNSYKKANYTLIITAFFLLTINQIKIFYMQEPIYLSDISLLGGLGEAMSITNGTLINFFTGNWLILLTQLLIFIGFIFLIHRIKEEPQKRKYSFLIQFIIFIILSLPFKFTTNIMKKIYNSFEDFSLLTDSVQYCMFYGITGNMYYNMLDNRIFIPDDYDQKEVDKVLNYKINKEEKNDNLNIVFVFSESFFDVSKISKNIEFSDNFLEDYQNLKKTNKTIQLVSPTYGGKSSNVEWELLTGFNLAYYNKDYIPYFSLASNKDIYKQENILSVLSKNNMKNYVYYSYDDSLYNAGKVYENLKFIKKKSINPKKKGFYESDDYLTDQIIETLKKEKSNLFYFATTMQSHMPYKKDKYDKYNVSIKKSNLNKEDQETILSYTEGLNDASLALKKLNDYIQTIDKKTIIIFMGDHLPYLSNPKGENLIDKLDYFNTNDNLVNTYRKYNTEALILSNFQIDFDDTKYLSPDLLMLYVLNSVNMKMTPYYSYLINESKEILPCYNKYVSVDNNGKLYYTSKLSKKMLEEYKLRESVQYNIYFSK